jgi:flagellar hook protein FlgE
MDLSAIALSGLQAASAAVDTAGRRMIAATSLESSADTVDLSTAAVELLASKTQFEANIQVMKTANQMESHVLDILG